jgi:hypothetical protein
MGNYVKYRVSDVGKDADNYSFINFSVFADEWCRLASIRGEVSGDPDKGYVPDVLNMKSAGQLRMFREVLKKRMNEKSTLLAKKDERKVLMVQLRDPTRSDNVAMAPPMEVPRQDARSSLATTGERVQVTPFAGSKTTGMTDEELQQIAMEEAEARSRNQAEKQPWARETRSRRPDRCRQCGHNPNSEVFRA